MITLAFVMAAAPQFASEEGALRVLGGSWDLHPGVGVQISRYDEVVPAPDLDGDGVDDVFRMPGFTSSGWHLGVEARSTASGALLWTRSLGNGADTLLETDDLDGDGVGDLVVSVSSSFPSPILLALSGVDGQPLWQQSGPVGSTRWGESLADGVDMDGDGVRDLVVVDSGTWQNPARLDLLSGADGTLLDTFTLAGVERIRAVLRLPRDVDGDGVPDYAFEYDIPYRAHRLGVYSFATGSLLWARDVDWVESLQAWEPDRDGDGSPELLTSAIWSGSAAVDLLTSRSGSSGRILHRLREPATAYLAVAPLTLCGDLDHDGREEFLRYQAHPAHSQLEVRSGADFEVLQRIHAEADHIFYPPRARMRFPGQSHGAAVVTYVSSSYQLPDLQIALSFDAALHADVDQVSLATGGTIHFEHDFPPSEAGRPCLLLVSHAARARTPIGSLPMPLAPGPLLTASLLLQVPGMAAPLQTLDAAAHGQSTLHVPPGAYPALAGRTLWFASLTWQGTFARRTSAALPITFN